MNDDITITDITMRCSTLELLYPRIFNRISLFWGHDDLEEVLNDLIIMDRPDRSGFCDNALDELLFLQELATTDKSIPQNFSFK